MKNFFIAIFLTGLSFMGFASGTGVYDKLIISKDTFLLRESPLYQLFQKNKIFQDALWTEIADCSPWWGKTFIGIWEIKSDSLFLNEVQLFSSEGAVCKKNIIHNCFLSEKIKDERIFADWYTGDLVSPRGKELFYCSSSEEYIFENDMIYEIKDGLLGKFDLYNNSKSQKSEYLDNPTLLKTYIYSNINWEKVSSEIDSTDKKVYCTIISCGDNAKVDSVAVVRGISPLLNAEAIRIVKSIPQWEIIYKKGLGKTPRLTIPINFNLKNMNQYYKSGSK